MKKETKLVTDDGVSFELLPAGVVRISKREHTPRNEMLMFTDLEAVCNEWGAEGVRLRAHVVEP